MYLCAAHVLGISPLYPTHTQRINQWYQTLVPLKIQIVLYFFQILGLDSSVNCPPCQREKLNV